VQGPVTGKEAGQLAVGQPLRDEDRAHGRPGQQVRAQPGEAMVARLDRAGLDVAQERRCARPGPGRAHPGTRGVRPSEPSGTDAAPSGEGAGGGFAAPSRIAGSAAAAVVCHEA
jgi:hypothetical protein